MNKYSSAFIMLIGLISITLFIVSCGSDSDDSSKEADLLYFYSTDSCCSDGDINYDVAFLEGYASSGDYTPPCRSQDSDDARQKSRITITWSNKTTGLNGLTEQELDYECFYIYGCGCWNVWSADIPLVKGNNAIKIKALHDDGRYEDWHRTITRQ